MSEPWFMLFGVAFGTTASGVGVGIMISAIMDARNQGRTVKWWAVALLTIPICTIWLWLPFVLYGGHRAVLFVNTILVGPEAMP